MVTAVWVPVALCLSAHTPAVVVESPVSHHAVQLRRFTEQTTNAVSASQTSVRARRSAVGCAIAAYFGGGVIGGLPGAVVGGAIGKDSGPALRGMVFGWSSGAVFVYRKCHAAPDP